MRFHIHVVETSSGLLEICEFDCWCITHFSQIVKPLKFVSKSPTNWLTLLHKESCYMMRWTLTLTLECITSDWCEPWCRRGLFRRSNFIWGTPSKTSSENQEKEKESCYQRRGRWVRVRRVLRPKDRLCIRYYSIPQITFLKLGVSKNTCSHVFANASLF